MGSSTNSYRSKTIDVDVYIEETGRHDTQKQLVSTSALEEKKGIETKIIQINGDSNGHSVPKRSKSKVKRKPNPRRRKSPLQKKEIKEKKRLIKEKNAVREQKAKENKRLADEKKALNE